MIDLVRSIRHGSNMLSGTVAVIRSIVIQAAVNPAIDSAPLVIEPCDAAIVAGNITSDDPPESYPYRFPEQHPAPEIAEMSRAFKPGMGAKDRVRPARRFKNCARPADPRGKKVRHAKHGIIEAVVSRVAEAL